MKKSIFSVLFSLFLLLLTLKGSEGEPFQFLQFVLQYPKGFCYNTNQCISLVPAKFTVHGIWPSNYTDIHLNCSNAAILNPFSETEITSDHDLQTGLENSWPTLLRRYNNNNIRFWREQYAKHGACTVPPFTQKSYFEKGHELWNKYDIHAVLDQSNIKPSNSSSYTMTRLVTAIQTKIGIYNNPVLKCKKDTRLGFIIREVIICLDHQAKNEISCPQIIKTDCWNNNKIYYVA